MEMCHLAVGILAIKETSFPEPRDLWSKDYMVIRTGTDKDKLGLR